MEVKQRKQLEDGWQTIPDTKLIDEEGNDDVLIKTDEFTLRTKTKYTKSTEKVYTTDVQNLDDFMS